MQLIVWQLRRAPTCAPLATTVGVGEGGPPSLWSAVEAPLSFRRCWSVLEQETELCRPARGDKRRDPRFILTELRVGGFSMDATQTVPGSRVCSHAVTATF